MADNNNIENEIIGTQGFTGDTGAQGPQGAQGRVGSRGERGLQGETGPQGFQGNTGATGAQGSKGSTGAQGTKGKSGLAGPAGPRGAQGAQGPQGEQGPQGPTGPQGIDGIKGYQGAQGNEGPQGNRGPAGIQGGRGCVGPQGPAGVKGTQGAQGARGENGAQGARGCSGNQGPTGMTGGEGPQGARGAQGRNGYMGYQGPDGSVGVQGVQGREGAVWYDGVRLDGYNTHLFSFNSVAGKFVAPAEQTNYLRIEDGALIQIWLDSAAYESIRQDGEIVIDNVEDGVLTPTHYVAYYSDSVGIMEKISPADNINSILDFTFRDGAWYYSGGSLLGAGGGTVDAVITKEIKVAGVNIGSYQDGDVITVGTAMQKVFENIFTNEIDVVAVPPQVELTLYVNDVPTTENVTVEIGEEVTLRTTVNFVDGEFVGKPGYDYYRVNAGCQVEGVEWSVDGQQVVGDTYTFTVGAGDVAVQATATYSGSTVIPEKNTGKPSAVTIPGGSEQSEVINLVGVNRGYWNIVPSLNDFNFDQYTVTQNDLANFNTFDIESGTGFVETMVSTDQLPSFVAVIPQGYSVTHCEDRDGNDTTGTWYLSPNTVQYTVGSAEATYVIYAVPAYVGNIYNNITFSR